MSEEKKAELLPSLDLSLGLEQFQKSGTLAKTSKVGPGAYTPDYRTILLSAPRACFSKQQRFLPIKVGYASKTDSQTICEPKYMLPLINDPRFKKAPVWSWGDRESNALREHRTATFLTHGSDDVGPAGYSPKVDLIKGAAPKASFPKAQRFDMRGFSERQPTGYGVPGPGTYVVSEKPKFQQTPRYSFGLPQDTKDTNKTATVASRSSFLTHTVRGGLITLCPLGPGDYDIPSLDRVSVTRAPRCVFSQHRRFVRSGMAMEQIAEETPSAKYHVPGAFAQVDKSGKPIDKKQSRRHALTWMP
eukprot:TRINITY_DN57_c4_g1_i1.p1 TRINITY_DN57_c4_g1~~TRINITY_DN57_c4_g1_i1.p1  ORF type:complete len:303 (-),score=35.08 TRINITY_DN57_c4_g1_i1:1439-2347(-)